MPPGFDSPRGLLDEDDKNHLNHEHFILSPINGKLSIDQIASKVDFAPDEVQSNIEKMQTQRLLVEEANLFNFPGIPL